MQTACRAPTSAIARLPTPVVVSLASPLARGANRQLRELCNTASSSQQHPKWVQLGAEHCGDGPRGRVNAAVLADGGVHASGRTAARAAREVWPAVAPAQAPAGCFPQNGVAAASLAAVGDLGEGVARVGGAFSAQWRHLLATAGSAVPAPSTPVVASLGRGAFALGSASVVLADPGHAFLKRSALYTQNRGASGSARLPTPAMVSPYLCKAVMPPHPRNSRCSLELCIVETGPHSRVSAAVLGVLVAFAPGPHRRRRCSLVPPPPRSNHQSWRCGQRHVRRSGLPQTWALALARAPAGQGAGPSCPKATARPRLTGRGQLPERAGRQERERQPAPAGAPTGERAGRGPSPPP
jgi:hypothetical protein